LLILLFCILGVVHSAPFWKVFCDRQPIYRGRADPIVTPGKLSGHSHRVFGASNFDLGSISRSAIDEYNLMVNSPCTTCSLSIDKTAYWVPDLYYQWPNGSLSLVPQAGLTVYYPSRTGSGAQSNPSWKAFPPGLRMLAGSPSRRTFEPTSLNDQATSYACLGTTPSPETNAFPVDITACIYGLRAQVWFPMCWDGVNLDSPDHKQHMAYPSNVNGGDCPATHPVRVPGVFFEILFSITGFPKQNTNPFVWSCGDPTGYGLHGDFLNGWDQNVLQNAINDPTCDAKNTNNGNNVKACNTLAPYIINTPCLINHPIPNIEDLGYNHPISQLPGCNPITTATTTSGPCKVGPEPQTNAYWRRFLLQNKNSNLFVGAKDTNTLLTASVTVPYYSEIWTMKSLGNGEYSIESDLTGSYLTAPNSDPLICNRNSANLWEMFVISPYPASATPASLSTSIYFTIKAMSNNQYVSLAADSTLHATSTTIGDDQLWKLVDPSQYPYNLPVQALAGPDSNLVDSSSASGLPVWAIIVIVASVVVAVVILVVAVVLVRRSSGKMETV